MQHIHIQEAGYPMLEQIAGQLEFWQGEVTAVRLNTTGGIPAKNPEEWPCIFEVKTSKLGQELVDFRIRNVNSGYRGQGSWYLWALLNSIGFGITQEEIFETCYDHVRFKK